jgi:transglutaminase-like putative cysteine protease
MPIMGMEVIRTTREAVLAEKFTSPPEIFVASSVRLSQPLPASRKEIVYRMRPKKGSSQKLTLNPSDAAGHAIEKNADDGSWTIQVRTVSPSRRLALPIAVNARLRPFLAPNAYIESDDDKLIRQARLTIGPDSDAWTAAKKLERWVYENVRNKNLETAFATAKEVFDTRAGDCTEHAVLLAGLTRAVGIPSRVVAGLTYYRQSFVGHMWTEVWIGEWVALDATIGKGRVEADHIGFATSPLAEASISDVFLGLIPVLSGVEIDVVQSK